MIKVFSVSEMEAAEKASDVAGNHYEEMMEKAGHGVAKAIIDRYPIAGKKVTILVGPGNNGGDGLVAGRYLAEEGADVVFYLYKHRDAATDSNFAKAEEMGLQILVSEYDQRFRVLRNRLQITNILIDSLLGTGVSRPIGGQLARLMGQIKAALEERRHLAREDSESRLTAIDEVAGNVKGSNLKIVAVDCPSGLNCDSGALDELALPADLTVTFAGPKRGHFLLPGAAACGEIVVVDIDIAPELPEVAAVPVELITAEVARKLLPDRPRDGHKGTFGWVMIAAGSARYWGAAVLAGKGAYRTGAGLVALAVPSTIRGALATQLPEATYPLISDEEILDQAAARQIFEDIQSYQALLVGPGLYEAAGFMTSLLGPDRSKPLPPMVIDADGLNLLSRMNDWPALLPEDCVLTPHLGEMARLMGYSIGQLKEVDRMEVAQAQAAKWGCVVLLKGAYTVIAAPDGRCGVLPFAVPALATAGSGDVLSGVIVALLGQGLPTYEAAILGGYLHAAAGKISGLEAGLLAGEIADRLPQVRDRLLKHE
jgi:hydroxyethylthiazole kinase-like uncharacterized protein yjeF